MAQTLESRVHVAGIAKIGETLVSGLDFGHRCIVFVSFDTTSLNPSNLKDLKIKSWATS